MTDREIIDKVLSRLSKVWVGHFEGILPKILPPSYSKVLVRYTRLLEKEAKPVWQREADMKWIKEFLKLGIVVTKPERILDTIKQVKREAEVMVLERIEGVAVDYHVGTMSSSTQFLDIEWATWQSIKQEILDELNTEVKG